MKHLNILIAGSLLCLAIACQKKAPVRGCTDMTSLNYNSSAEADDGSCRFSQVTFYAKYGYYNGVPITSIDVSVNGNTLGTINTIYPTPPGNCGAQGTVAYSFSKNTSYNWNTVVHLLNGAIVYGSGTASPLAGVDCVKVNVTQ